MFVECLKKDGLSDTYYEKNYQIKSESYVAETLVRKPVVFFFFTVLLLPVSTLKSPKDSGLRNKASVFAGWILKNPH